MRSLAKRSVAVCPEHHLAELSLPVDIGEHRHLRDVPIIVMHLIEASSVGQEGRATEDFRTNSVESTRLSAAGEAPASVWARQPTTPSGRTMTAPDGVIP